MCMSRGHTWRCHGLTSGSELRPQSWQCWGDHTHCQGLNWSWPCVRQAYISPVPSYHLMLSNIHTYIIILCNGCSTMIIIVFQKTKLYLSTMWQSEAKWTVSSNLKMPDSHGLFCSNIKQSINRFYMHTRPRDQSNRVSLFSPSVHTNPKHVTLEMWGVQEARVSFLLGKTMSTSSQSKQCEYFKIIFYMSDFLPKQTQAS